MGHISRRRISAKWTGTIIVGPGSAARKLADALGKARSGHLSTSPLHHPARNAPQSCASRGKRFSLDKRILQDTAIPRNPSHLPYKEEVAGSIGHRPLIKVTLLQVKRESRRHGPANYESSLTPTRHQPGGSSMVGPTQARVRPAWRVRFGRPCPALRGSRYLALSPRWRGLKAPGPTWGAFLCRVAASRRCA
jgi:hypothetical protein